jgi:cytochrome b involved in lipid metabolism
MRQSLIASIIKFFGVLLSFFLANFLFAATLTLTRAEVAQHSTQENCWIIIDKEVFDITTYIAHHPPPLDIVIKDCGRDASIGWKTKGTKNKPHSKKAHILIKKYLIGVIKD